MGLLGWVAAALKGLRQGRGVVPDDGVLGTRQSIGDGNPFVAQLVRQIEAPGGESANVHRLPWR